MIVAAHGSVDLYCEARGMVIAERIEGDIEKYRGVCRVIVTDQKFEKNEFYYLKYRMLRRKVELISVYFDDVAFDEFVAYAANQRQKSGGRLRFGYRRRPDGSIEEDESSMVVVRRIFELRDAGATYKEIQADAGVHYPDGSRLSISTIQVILQNREGYENEC